MLFSMKNFVLWAGVYNAGLALVFPPLYRALVAGMGLVDRGLRGHADTHRVS